MTDREELTVRLWTTRDLGTSDYAIRFLEALEAAGQEWLPQRFGPYEPLKHDLDRDGIDAFESTWMTTRNSDYPISRVFFKTSRVLGLHGGIHWARGWNHDFNTVSLTLPLHKYQGRAAEVWSVAESLFKLIAAEYATMSTRGEFLSQHRNPEPGDTILGSRLGSHFPGVYYANFFGPRAVQFFNAGRMKGCPAVRNEPLPHGGWVITTAPEPEDWSTPQASALKEAVRRHLGERSFFDVRHSQRSTITPFFDFSEIRIGPRPEENTGTAVAPEFFPTITDAQEFVARIFERLEGWEPEISTAQLDFSAASLRAIDQAYAGRGSGSNDYREWILKIAAYFGEVLRRTLDGEWGLQEQDGSAMPILMLKDGRREYPLIRAVKLLEDGDRLYDWYTFVAAAHELKM